MWRLATIMHQSVMYCWQRDQRGGPKILDWTKRNWGISNKHVLFPFVPTIGKIANHKIWDVTLWQSNLTRKKCNSNPAGIRDCNGKSHIWRWFSHLNACLWKIFQLCLARTTWTVAHQTWSCNWHFETAPTWMIPQDVSHLLWLLRVIGCNWCMFKPRTQPLGNLNC